MIKYFEKETYVAEMNFFLDNDCCTQNSYIIFTPINNVLVVDLGIECSSFLQN